MSKKIANRRVCEQRHVAKTILVLLLLSPFIAQVARAMPVIKILQPDSSGTSINISGSGFTGTTEVLLTNKNNGAREYPSFAIVSDSQVIVDKPFSNSWLVSLFTDRAETVGIPLGFIEVTSAIYSGAGSQVYLVRSGGSLTGGFGSSTVFVESGGTYNNAGGGKNTTYVQENGTYIQGGGGSNLTFYEPLANIIMKNKGGGNVTTPVPEPQPSFLTPEPATALLLGIGGLMLRKFNRRVYKNT